MTIVRSLKQLLAKMGGTPETTDNQTITEVLADIYMYKANTTGVKFDTIMEALDNIATVTEGGGGGDGWAVHTLIDDSSVEFESNPEYPGIFVCTYPNVQLGYTDFLVITVDGDIEASSQFMVNAFGSTLPNGMEIPVTGGVINVYFGLVDSDIGFSISYDVENPPTQAPSVSLKVERIGDSSGEQPWAEEGIDVS